MKEKTVKLLLVAGAIIIALISVVLGTKLLLYINFLLGNDVVVKLETGPTYFSLRGDESAEIDFKARIVTNPFCSALCTSEFIDLSSGDPIDLSAFNVTPSNPVSQHYTIKRTLKGYGTDLYSFTLSCNSVRNFLCASNEVKTQRTVLVTVARQPSDYETLIKNDIKADVMAFSERMAWLKGFLAAARNSIDSAPFSLAEQSNELNILSDLLSEQEVRLGGLQQLWEKQDYVSLATELETTQISTSSVQRRIIELNGSLSFMIDDYNSLISTILLLRNQINYNTAGSFTDEGIVKAQDSLILDFNSYMSFFIGSNDLDSKRKDFARLGELENEIHLNSEILRNKTDLKKNLLLDIDYDILCRSAGICIAHPTLNLRVLEKSSQIDACLRANQLQVLLSNYTSMPKSSLDLARSQIAKEYISQLKLIDNVSNYQEVHNILSNLSASNAPINYSEKLLFELKGDTLNCSLYSVSQKALPFNESLIPLLVPLDVELDFSLKEPEPLCCLSGVCKACCDSVSCNSANYYPVIFLNGYRITNEDSAEYSLDSFNAFQMALESSGYINGGTITMYTSREAGKLATITSPVSFRASYYFDIFGEPENYVFTPTQSENIDTYSLRLKGLIDSVKERSGRDKVIIIAHSMGGLVTRRYLQIFGQNDVHELFFIGTPNFGLTPQIKDYCAIFGSRECQDMAQESLFIRKLKGQSFSVPVYNFVGVGCQMQGGDGDGVVLANSSYLPGATNIEIRGSCTTLDRLHTNLLKISSEPEVFENIRKVLAQD